MHGARQLAYPGGVEHWWLRYVESPEFRLAEKLPAHQAEFAWHRRHEGRHAQDRALAKIAGRLSGPLYGSVMSLEDARAMIAA